MRNERNKNVLFLYLIVVVNILVILFSIVLHLIHKNSLYNNKYQTLLTTGALPISVNYLPCNQFIKGINIISRWRTKACNGFSIHSNCEEKRSSDFRGSIIQFQITTNGKSTTSRLYRKLPI